MIFEQNLQRIRKQRQLSDSFSGDFLKDALMHCSKDNPFRGPALYQKGSTPIIPGMKETLHGFAGRKKSFIKRKRCMNAIFMVDYYDRYRQLLGIKKVGIGHFAFVSERKMEIGIKNSQMCLKRAGSDSFFTWNNADFSLEF